MVGVMTMSRSRVSLKSRWTTNWPMPSRNSKTACCEFTCQQRRIHRRRGRRIVFQKTDNDLAEMVQRTEASRFAQRRIQDQGRLTPVADLYVRCCREEALDYCS